MKKLLFFVCIAASMNYVSAQFTVYDHNFNDSGSEGWTIVDHDENGYYWNVINNTYNSVTGGGESFQVLSLPDYELTGGAEASNWAILPVQDMSYYTGSHLTFSYLKGFFEIWGESPNLYIYAYVSADGVPSVEDFLTQEPIANPILEGDMAKPPVAVPVTVDIPEEYNVANVYFAIAYQRDEFNDGGFILELTGASVTADELVMGTEELTQTKTIIKQNPVQDQLQLQLGSRLEAADTRVQVYNANGAIVKETVYNDDISLNGLPSGAYFMVISDGTVTEKLKFVKK